MVGKEHFEIGILRVVQSNVNVVVVCAGIRGVLHLEKFDKGEAFTNFNILNLPVALHNRVNAALVHIWQPTNEQLPHEDGLVYERGSHGLIEEGLNFLSRSARRNSLYVRI